MSVTDEAKATDDVITPDEIARLLRDAGSPEALNPDYACQRFASVMGLMRAYPPTQAPSSLNPIAVELERAVASLRRTLPEYIIFLGLAEDLPNIPESYKTRLQKLRQLVRLLEDTFPLEKKRPRKRQARWRQVGQDVFEYQAGTQWHELALYLFACYQDVVDPSCGISRDGAAVRFIRAALERCGVGHFTTDAIEKALSRAKKTIPRIVEPS
jgi:hypothetical protein